MNVDESKILRDRMVPKGMARLTYFTPPHTLRRLKIESPIADLLQEIHHIRVRYSGTHGTLLKVVEWSPNRQRFVAYFTDNPNFSIGVTQHHVSPKKYHMAIYITDMADADSGMMMADEEFEEFATMFIDLQLRTLNEVKGRAE